MKLHWQIRKSIIEILINRNWKKCMFGYCFNGIDYSIRIWKKKQKTLRG